MRQKLYFIVISGMTTRYNRVSEDDVHGQVIFETMIQSPNHEQDITGISRLSPLLQTLPSLATSAHIASHQYMEVLIDGSLASVKDGPGFRGFSLGEKGIKEHAVLLNPDKLSQLVNAGMLLNVASAVLAQKHLADISKKLTEIVEAMREVSAFQNNKRKSKITGAIEYLQQITPVVIEEQYSPAIRQNWRILKSSFPPCWHTY